MAAPAEVAAPVSAQVVGNAFVQQYYLILHQSPGLVHKFYHEDSKLGRPDEDGTMSITTTMDEINAKILSLNYEDFKAEIKYVDAQESLAGGVNVLVTGHLTGKDNIVHNFTQSFFLAPQDKGYFVLNDMFRYMDKPQHTESSPTEDVMVPDNNTPEEEVVQVPDNNTPEEPAVVPEETQPEKIVVEENGEVKTEDVKDQEQDEEEVAEVVDEVPEPSKVVVVEVKAKSEETIKKSYASIVKDLKQNGVPFSPPPPVMRKPQPRIQEQQLNNNNNALTTTVVSEQVSNVDSTENGVHDEEGEGYSVYIKGLPVSATPAILEEEFKKFGLIKANGIQVRSNRQQGFCFGFVEFETPEAVQKAIEASPVSIGGRNSVVEEKRSTSSRGGGRGRFTAGRGGGGVRGGRGSYSGGGRGFSRGGDFSGGRSDYGYRSGRGGPASSRGGGNGYQRDNNNNARVVAQ